ncbi:hypothetical protein [Fusobacterium russii]|uniref:hypothetical protein n=1 Tax=Fusobacterium russii TaxID=854 RepID=UPI0003A75490|nr:hypothetical protein [Fusobacterium russii]
MNFNNIFIIYPLMLVLVVIFWFFSSKRNKSKQESYAAEFLKKYPEAVKVYTQANGGFIVSYNLQIYSVNDELPAAFSDEQGSGFYCKTGKNIIEVEYSTTRPGVIYKTVTKSTGATKIEVETKAGENYFFYFDKDTNSFKLDIK